MKTFSLLSILTLMHFNVFAQFPPYEFGYNPEEAKYFASLHVKTQTSNIPDSNGVLSPYEVNYYNEEGRITESVTTYNSLLASLGYNPVITLKYMYSTEGKIDIITITGIDSIPNIYAFSYNDKSQITQYKVTSKGPVADYIYTYNDMGQVVNKSGVEYIWILDEVDYEEHLIADTVQQVYYNWGSDGKLTGESNWYANEWQSRIAYTYNEQARLNEKSIYTDDSDSAAPIFNARYFYNPDGLIDKLIVKDEGGEITYVFTYTYY